MIKLTFHGAAQEVTGMNYLLECDSDVKSGRAVKLLVDCGLFQGARTAEEKNRDPFPYNPSEIDILFVTHAHLDHIGRIPKLVRDGFKGRIISTLPTRDLAELSLTDSLGILTKEAERDGEEPIYAEEDVLKAMSLWETTEYDKDLKINDLTVIFREAGHILGSSMIEIQRGGKKMVFSGDLGNPPTPLLKDPYKLKDANYLIMESTYGDKEHEGRGERKIKIERVIEDTVKNNGVLMIPAFSIERTQELLFEMNDLVENGRIPSVPVFLDSPLAIKATSIYQKYEDYYNKGAKYIINSGDDVFKFPGLKFTLRTQESKEINDVPAPKIIIAGSGMSTGGRIVHHEKRYLSDEKNTLLLVGFQSAGSLGRRIQEGAKWVKILGDDIPVKAKVVRIKGYSAHPDTNWLLKFAKRNAKSLKKVFVTQGEVKASSFISQRIRDYLGIESIVPELGNSFDIDM
ncbi:MAG: MBL fold metallo-hydrolase [Candidatus Marinimicrobia bacterium]|nr:MBL fold metallo-hydrolase [Candidatus Neomarinimicrobiota bacterium]